MKLQKLFFIGFFFFAQTVFANENIPSWFQEGPYLASSTAAFEVPIEDFATKLYVEIEIEGKPRRFVFDSGSPSMIDSAIVDELGLKVVGKNKGMDAHGVVVETDIVQVDMTIGGTEILKVPMMSADFSASVPTKAFIGDGVLGSDLLRLGVWQIDL